MKIVLIATVLFTLTNSFFFQHSKEATENYWNQCKHISDNLSRELKEMWFVSFRSDAIGNLYIEAADKIRNVPKIGVAPAVIDNINDKIVYFETVGYITKNSGFQSWMSFALEAGALIPEIAKSKEHNNKKAIPRIAVPNAGPISNEGQNMIYDYLTNIRNQEQWVIRYIREKYGLELTVW